MRRWTVVGVLAALVLSAAPSPAAAAFVWEEPVRVAGPQASAGNDSLVTFGASGSIVAYGERGESQPTPDETHSYLRRTGDGVTTIIPLGSGKGSTFAPSLAGRGNDIDVVWMRDGGRGPYVKYRSSADAGLTWSATQNLTPVGEPIFSADVDRDGRGRVAAVWNAERQRVRIRVSTDGGASFRKAVTVARGESPRVAVGGRVITVAYIEPCCPELPDDFEGEFGSPLVVRRSTDNGRTWSAPTTLASWVSNVDIHAVGKTVVVAYGKITPEGRQWAALRRSGDAGASWGPGVALSPKIGEEYEFPIVSARSGVWHAAYQECLSSGPEQPCEEGLLRYLYSLDNGRSWSARELLPVSGEFLRPVGVSATGAGPLIAWFAANGSPEKIGGCFCRREVFMAGATDP